MRRYIPPFIDALYIIGCSVFGLGGMAIGLYSVVILFLCFAPLFVRRPRWKKIFFGLMVFLLVVATNMISLLWVFLYYSGVGWLLLYCGLVAGATLLIHRTKWFSLSWRHGMEIAIVVGLALEVGILNFHPGERPVVSAQIRQLVDYRQFPENGPMALQIVADERDEVYFICNRPKDDAGQGFNTLLRYERSSGATERIDLDGLTVQTVVYDQYSATFLALGYNESQAFSCRDNSRHMLFRIDPQGAILAREHLTIPGDRYSFLLTTPDEIQVYSAILSMEAIDRRTGEHREQFLPIFAGISAMTNLLAWEGKYIVNCGGSVLEFLIFPGMRIVDGKNFRTIRAKRFLSGTYVLAWDPVRREIYTNNQWSGSLTVLDENLRVKRRVPLGKVIRSLAIDPERRVGYINDYIGGNLVAFSLDTGKNLGSVFIGKHGRGIHVDRDGSVVTGSRWGVYRVTFPQIALK